MQMNLTNRLGNFKIGPRLTLSYGLILFLMIIAFLYSGYSVYSANRNALKLDSDNTDMLLDMNAMSENLAIVAREMRTLILLHGNAEVTQRERKIIEKARDDFNVAYKHAVSTAVGEESALLKVIDDTRAKAIPINNKVMDLEEQGKLEEALNLLLTQGAPALEARQAALDKYKLYQVKEIQDAAVESTQEFNKAMGIAGIFLIIVLAIAAFLARQITKSITSPLHTLQAAINDVRQGGSLGSLANIATKDEMNEMGFAVNQLLQDQVSAREKAEEDRKKAEAEKKKAEEENESLNNSVIAVLQAVYKLSQKDLTVKVPVSTDIMGTVADSLNALSDATSSVLHGVNVIANQVAQASGKVQAQGELVSKTANEERKNVGEMVESLNEASQTMNQVASLAEQSNRSAERATQATVTALATVNNTVKGMEAIRETISETEKRIKRLGERSQEISGIVNLINTIAERTHVLSLNASMQAAVAGEAGRGFAVVAEEVQRLAESSRNATQQISTLVNNIQLETNETISTVNRTISQVVQGSEQAQQAGEQMRLTQGITDELVAQVRHIAETTEVQKAMSAKLLSSVQRLGVSNDRTAEQIETQGLETQSLLASSQQLVESINVFKLPTFA